MEIDIINYTPEQYAVLTSSQLAEIRSAQIRKNALTKAMEKRLLKKKQEMIDDGSFLSDIWARVQSEIEAECDAEVAIVRESLLFFLHYSSNAYNPEVNDNPTVPSVGYRVDYSLTEEERMIDVRDYYLQEFPNDTERFYEYDRDAFAKSYLGEGYAPIWHYFKTMMEQ